MFVHDLLTNFALSSNIIKIHRKVKKNITIVTYAAMFYFLKFKQEDGKMLSSIFSLVEEILATAGAGESAQKIVSAVFDGILGILG